MIDIVGQVIKITSPVLTAWKRFDTLSLSKLQGESGFNDLTGLETVFC